MQRRAALEKKARERTREKAEREAHAKALVEQREQARAAAEQEAARRRAAEQAARAAAPVAAVAPVRPATAPPPRGVAEICAGRNAISRGICEARECMGSAHADEAVCKRLREIDDRRRQ